MQSTQYEIEIKSLLGNDDSARVFRTTLVERYPEVSFGPVETQLNHYFEGGDPHAVIEKVVPYVSEEEGTRLTKIATEGNNISVRTREVAGTARFIMKASVGDDSSSNGVARAEVDIEISYVSLEELDGLVLSAGYTYQAKWSRSRESLEIENTTICLDRNAGYGYLVEFERVVDDAQHIEDTKRELERLMAELGTKELPQERLERMFAHYNANWAEYYGTDKVFTIE
jgi:adenylate cyclase class IV